MIRSYHGQEVDFTAKEPITVVVDGEVMRDAAFTVRLSEKKVNFFYPAGAGYQVDVRTDSYTGVGTTEMNRRIKWDA